MREETTASGAKIQWPASIPYNWPFGGVVKSSVRFDTFLKASEPFFDRFMTAGYHQAELHPESQKYTTFKTHSGTYQWIRVPFGLKGAPSYYQQQIANALEGLLYHKCEVYIDDIIIYGATEQQFTENLRAVMERLHERGITVNPAKCKFGLTEVEYVGHVISSDSFAASEITAFKML